MLNIKKIAALTAAGAFAVTASFAQDAEEEVCLTQAEYTAKMQDEWGEMLLYQKRYDGKDYLTGLWSFYVNEQAGSWTLALDPDEPLEESSCEQEDATYWISGDNSGYPDGVQFEPWYDDIFKGPKFM